MNRSISSFSSFFAINVAASLVVGCAATSGGVKPDTREHATPDEGVPDAGPARDGQVIPPGTCAEGEEWSYVDLHCARRPLGASAGDACGPGGEGAVAYAPCDARRGLKCAPPAAGEIDAPPTCACATGQTWSSADGLCTGHRLGERPGDACGPGGEGANPFAPCDGHRGLECAPPPPETIDAPPACACAFGTAWVEALRRCASRADAGCRP